MIKKAIVCHDAGGAELISNWVLNQKESFYYVIDGPAKEIFRRNLLSEIKIISLDESLNLCDTFICGTSWNSNLEKKAIKHALDLNKFVIVQLDHWVNYENRFIYQGKLNLPNEIWVVDNYAKEISELLFPNTKIILKNNYYLDKLIKKASQYPEDKKSNNTALFVAENIKDHALKVYGDKNIWGYTEFEAISYFLKHFEKTNLNIKEIKIRPHPSDEAKKYDWALNNKFVTSVFSDNTLIEDIKQSSIIVGCESMALIVGIYTKKKVISCIPPGGMNCRLPHKEILHFEKLLKV